MRDTEARFVSQVLPLVKRRSTTIETFVPELYLHGLALGDVELALRFCAVSAVNAADCSGPVVSVLDSDPIEVLHNPHVLNRGRF